MNKLILIISLLLSFSFRGFSQDVKTMVINDTTELQEYANGEKLKVNYRLNSKLLTIKEKEKLLNDHPGLGQEFNIKNVNNEMIGEINFLGDDILITAEVLRPKQLDISGNVTGKLFPDFDWTDINNNRLSLEQLKGKVIVLNFWHTSCIPCVAEMPLLNKLSEKYADAEVLFIAATPNSKDELKRFLEKKEFNYKQVSGIDTITVISPFPGWPIHIVLNKKGIVEFFALGKQNNIEQKLSKSIEQSLGELE